MEMVMMASLERAWVDLVVMELVVVVIVAVVRDFEMTSRLRRNLSAKVALVRMHRNVVLRKSFY